jgi:hypothetical protein
MSSNNVPSPWATHEISEEQLELLSDERLDVFSEFGEATACTPVEVFRWLDRYD